MTIKSNLATIGLGALIAVTSVGAASAAVSNSGTAVHSRPSYSSHVVNYLHRGERTRIEAVRNGWCEVSIPGPDGWVPCSALGRYPMSYFRPGITFNFGFGFPGIGIHTGPGPWWWWNQHTGSWWNNQNDSHNHDQHQHP